MQAAFTCVACAQSLCTATARFDKPGSAGIGSDTQYRRVRAVLGHFADSATGFRQCQNNACRHIPAVAKENTGRCERSAGTRKRLSASETQKTGSTLAHLIATASPPIAGERLAVRCAIPGLHCGRRDRLRDGNGRHHVLAQAQEEGAVVDGLFSCSADVGHCADTLNRIRACRKSNKDATRNARRAGKSRFGQPR